MDIKRTNALRKTKLLIPYLRDKLTVLDFGCGDLTMAHELHRLNPQLAITGLDVVDFGARYRGIEFIKFDGITIPFPAKSFDAVVAYHVFHHTGLPEKLLAECARVVKDKVIFVEPVYRVKWEIPGMILTDWLFNVWKHESIPMAYSFHSFSWWEKTTKKEGLKIREIKDVELLPRCFPTGRSLLFYTTKTQVCT